MHQAEQILSETAIENNEDIRLATSLIIRVWLFFLLKDSQLLNDDKSIL